MLRRMMIVLLACAAVSGCWQERKEPWFDMNTSEDEPVLPKPDAKRFDPRSVR